MVLSNMFDGSRQKHASRAVILESPRPAASYALNAVKKSRHTYSACLKQVQSDSRRMTPPKQELSAFSAQPTVNASDAAMRWGGIGVVSLLVETRTWNIDTACSCIFCSYLGDVSWKVRFFGTWFLRKRCRFKVLYMQVDRPIRNAPKDARCEQKQAKIRRSESMTTHVWVCNKKQVLMELFELQEIQYVSWRPSLHIVHCGDSPTNTWRVSRKSQGNARLQPWTFLCLVQQGSNKDPKRLMTSSIELGFIYTWIQLVVVTVTCCWSSLDQDGRFSTVKVFLLMTGFQLKSSSWYLI